ncbi:MAG: LuxR C-terminal-related transcriptional regulator [Anaerolineae bacterium]|nr:LuxR C-terminal-related transcriptional regulator [Anaerolineae bacterium]
MGKCPLSERELEILRMVASGATNQQIASKLFISLNTVKVHLRNIFEKLGVQSRTEAVMLAVREGWIEVGEVTFRPPELQVFPLPFWKKFLLTCITLLAAVLVALPWLRAIQADEPSSFLIDRPSSPQLSSMTASGRWLLKSFLPAPRSRMAVALSGNAIFIIGGEVAGNVTGETLAYYPGENRWEKRAQKPTPVSNVGAVSLNGKIYVPGGYTSDGVVIDALEIYEPSKDTWTKGAPLPVPLCGYAIASYQGKVYLFGGWDGKRALARAFRYDPQTDEWEELPSMLIPRAFAAAGVLNDRIYVAGGLRGSREIRDVEEFNPVEMRWQKRSPMLIGRAGFGLSPVGHWIYAIGGGWKNRLTFNERYDPSADLWTPFETPILGEWRNLGVVALGNKIYAIGGKSGEPLAFVEEYQALFTVMIPYIQR